MLGNLDAGAAQECASGDVDGGRLRAFRGSLEVNTSACMITHGTPAERGRSSCVFHCEWWAVVGFLAQGQSKSERGRLDKPPGCRYATGR